MPTARKPSSLLPLLVVGGLAFFAIAAAVAIAGLVLYMDGGVFSRPIGDTPAPVVETQPTPPEPPSGADPRPDQAPAEAPAPERPATAPPVAERDEAPAPALRDGDTRPARRPDPRGDVESAVPEAPPRPPPAHQALRVGGQIRQPAKIRNVVPVYPAIAQQARVQGVVIVEATIGPSGKVVDTRVLRSIPLLDQAALDAVRQWEYEPTLLNGEPVPVIMTVTVNFALNRD